jgi:hypothetical protein
MKNGEGIEVESGKERATKNSTLTSSNWNANGPELQTVTTYHLP